MRDSEHKKVFNEIAQKCEVEDFRHSNVSSLLEALAAVEFSKRLEKRQKNILLTFWTWIRKIFS